MCVGELLEDYLFGVYLDFECVHCFLSVGCVSTVAMVNVKKVKTVWRSFKFNVRKINKIKH